MKNHIKRLVPLAVAIGLVFGNANIALAEPVKSSGTGFFINSNGWIVTNAHVVETCTKTAVSGHGDVVETKLDTQNDLAAVRVTSTTSLGLPLRTSGARLGEDVVSFGFPLSDVLSSSIKVTTGNVNSLMGLADDARYIQISTPLQPGNSGGPVVDLSGNVVGIATAILKPEAGGGSIPQNVNFALRSKTVEGFLESRGIDFAGAPGGADLRTADLADKVAPAVVQVLCYGSTARETADLSEPVARPNMPTRAFDSLDDHDIIGFDYRTLRNVSRSQCQKACSDDRTCKALTYNKRQRFCFLKDGAALAVKNQDAYAVVDASLSSTVMISTFVVGSGLDMAGGDYARRTTNFVGCYLACEGDYQCRAFSYVRKNRTCWLKDVVGRLTRKAGVDTGIK